MAVPNPHDIISHRSNQGGLILDVRSPQEFAEGHLTGALNVPIDDLEARLAELGSRPRPIAIYCRSGRRSAVAAQILRRAGFESVTDMGGLDAIRANSRTC